MNDTTAVIDRLVQDIRHAGQVTRAPVEQATGTALHAVGEDAYFRSYRAGPIDDGDLRLSLDLREPKPNSGATAGAILVVNVAGGCADKSALEARYGAWRLTDAPRGRSLDEQAYWTKTEPWGELSFGFAEGKPDCLRSIVFQAAGPR